MIFKGTNCIGKRQWSSWLTIHSFALPQHQHQRRTKASHNTPLFQVAQTSSTRMAMVSILALASRQRHRRPGHRSAFGVLLPGNRGTSGSSPVARHRDAERQKSDPCSFTSQRLDLRRDRKRWSPSNGLLSAGTPSTFENQPRSWLAYRVPPVHLRHRLSPCLSFPGHVLAAQRVHGQPSGLHVVLSGCRWEFPDQLSHLI